MKKILVTGGAGYIGSHTCLALLENGLSVVVVDSLVNSSLRSLKKIFEISKNKNLKFMSGDIRDKSFLTDIFNEEKKIGEPIDAVIHLAGLKSVSESVSNPVLYWDVNVRGSINLLEVMDLNYCSTIVFSSSATIYDSSNNSILNENSLVKPINAYGNTKVSIEVLLNNLYLSNTKKWRIINLRYFNPIGAHPLGLIGENAKREAQNIFPIISKVGLGNIKQLEIYGNNWSTKDGTPVRDYLHIMDLARGHLSALDFLIKNNSTFLNINLGSGTGISVLELVNIFQDVNKIRIPYIFKERRLGDPGYLVADISLAKKLLNWIPKFTIEEMCEHGWKWESKK